MLGGGEASLCSWLRILLLGKYGGRRTVERLLLLHLYQGQEGELEQILSWELGGGCANSGSSGPWHWSWGQVSPILLCLSNSSTPCPSPSPARSISILLLLCPTSPPMLVLELFLCTSFTYLGAFLHPGNPAGDSTRPPHHHLTPSSTPNTHILQLTGVCQAVLSS